MSFYKNTHAKIIRIVPAIAAENNIGPQKFNVAIPVGSICSFDIRDFEYPSDDLNNPVVSLRCIKCSTGDCTGCYFRYLPSFFCPMCSRADRRDNSDVIFEEVRV